MDANGGLHLGITYRPKVKQLAKLLGLKKESDAVRAAIDAVLEDADEARLTSIPRRALGLKPFTTSTKPVARRKAQKS